jgi:hypothetical protein
MEQAGLDLHLHDFRSKLYLTCTRCFECGLYHDACCQRHLRLRITVVITSPFCRCSRSGSDLRWNKNLYVHLYQLRWNNDRLDLHLHHSCARPLHCLQLVLRVWPVSPMRCCQHHLRLRTTVVNTITPSAGVAGVDPTCAGTKTIRSPIPIAMEQR